MLSLNDAWNEYTAAPVVNVEECQYQATARIGIEPVYQNYKPRTVLYIYIPRCQTLCWKSEKKKCSENTLCFYSKQMNFMRNPLPFSIHSCKNVWDFDICVPRPYQNVNRYWRGTIYQLYMGFLSFFLGKKIFLIVYHSRLCHATGSQHTFIIYDDCWFKIKNKHNILIYGRSCPFRSLFLILRKFFPFNITSCPYPNTISLLTMVGNK